MSQFTKKAIMTAFIDLIAERPLDKITVKDIVNKCEINRNTFYYYFQDIYQLIEDLFELETQKIVGEKNDFSSWQDAFLKAIDFAYQNKQGIYHIYKSISREQLENYLNKVTFNNMLSFVENEAAGLNTDPKDLELIAKFYSHALVGMVLEWMNDGMRGDSKEFISKLGVLFEGNIRFCLTKNQTN